MESKKGMKMLLWNHCWENWAKNMILKLKLI